jgi:HEAT repeat protein
MVVKRMVLVFWRINVSLLSLSFLWLATAAAQQSISALASKADAETSRLVVAENMKRALARDCSEVVAISALASKADVEASRRVAEIMKRVLARDCSVGDGWTTGSKPVRGVVRISWVPPSDEDYADIAQVGEGAVPALAAYVTPDAKPGGFIQAIAVRFLGSIGSALTIAPLGEALDPRNWQVARIYALDFLGSMPEPEAISLVCSVLRDNDPQVAERAEEILLSRNE